MLRIEPAEFLRDLTEVAAYLKDCVSFELADILGLEFRPEDHHDDVIEEWSKAVVHFKNSDEEFSVQYVDLVHWVIDVCKTAKMNDRTYLCWEKGAYVHVRAQNAKAYALLGKLAEFPPEGIGSSVLIGAHEADVRIRAAPTPFNVFVAKNFTTDEDHPPIWSTDAFVEIYCTTSQVSVDAASDVANAFLFELSSTLGADFRVEPYPDPAESERFNREIDDLRAQIDHSTHPLNLRPLLVGRGLDSLLDLFLSAVNVDDEDFAILNYIRCVEYVGATVAKRLVHSQLRMRLAAPQAVVPDADYLDGLLAVMSVAKSLERDAEIIRATIAMCCDAPMLAPLAPPVLKSLKRLTHESKPEECAAALEQLATCAVATRNEIAHAKSNYRRTGNECPVDQMPQFAILLRTVADQVIRWFAGLPSAHRVLSPHAE